MGAECPRHRPTPAPGAASRAPGHRRAPPCLIHGPQISSGGEAAGRGGRMPPAPSETRDRPRKPAPQLTAAEARGRGADCPRPAEGIARTACKPGSVLRVRPCDRSRMDDHSSRPAVAGGVQLPTRASRVQASLRAISVAGSPPREAPIWHCSRWGLPCRSGCPSRGGLLPHRFTLAHACMGGLVLCGAFPGVAPAGRYPAPCLVEPGLSSSGSPPPRSSGHPHEGGLRPRARRRQPASARPDPRPARHLPHRPAPWPRGESASGRRAGSPPPPDRGHSRRPRPRHGT